jgi:DNA-binding response OmpR family regulator
MALENVSVCIAEDNTVITTIIRRILRDCKMLYVATSAPSVISLMHEFHPDILCLDGNLLGGTAEDVLKELAQSYHDTLGVVIVSGREVEIPAHFPFAIQTCQKPFTGTTLRQEVINVMTTR